MSASKRGKIIFSPIFRQISLLTVRRTCSVAAVNKLTTNSTPTFYYA